jgi:ABC-type nitrate/sulfonate/bicarbonate transport system ATPase subunit
MHDAEEAVCLSDRIFVMGLNPGHQGVHSVMGQFEICLA